ncbi:A-kinase anchor protein 4-like [Varanus komodoensis]|uniref:A-kinase anchor protein 4-like n=1 Tax=Varanus komodoensis TaxID=61221 RepID=UPI001CF79268|nr:A-kinase anchor protein 4-like [Varanus komodoensis]
MAHEIDWLRSQAGVCKVNHYSAETQKDQDRKMICFVDVSSLNVKDKDQKGYNELDLGSLEEKEVIVIKDNERNNPNNTEGAVCLFKQGSSEELNVVSWLSNDLQKYAIGFQHALTPSSGSRKSQPYTISADKLTTTATGQRSSDDPSYVNRLCSMVVQKARQEIKDKLESNSNSMRQPLNAESKVSTPRLHDNGSEKPWSMDLHAKDIFGMTLKMIQQHLMEKNREASREISSPSYTHRESTNFDRAGGSQVPKCLPGPGGLQDPPHHEPPKTSISNILLSLVQKVLREAASSLDEATSDAQRSCKPASTS